MNFISNVYCRILFKSLLLTALDISFGHVASLPARSWIGKGAWSKPDAAAAFDEHVDAAPPLLYIQGVN